MCQFCVEHGEGKKWYLQAKNYSQELLNEERKLFMADFFENFERMVRDRVGALDKLMAADPSAAKNVFPSLVERQQREHWGQVIPLEEVEQILDRSLAVVRVPCVCRSTLRGIRDARYCFGVTTTPSDWRGTVFQQYPDYSSDLEVLDKEEAKKAIQKLDRNGLVHTVWTFLTPLIGGLCNCTVNDCLALKTRTRLGFPTFFKAEYVATIDWETCSGCRDCMKVCNFGAISYSAYVDKCSINQLQCYGCGVCRAACLRDAITLRDRNAVPALRSEW
jgi:NAD-dependent dihydropyrimidine dehydrogenase PreA subunit